VRAVDGAGNSSGYSNIAEATTAAPPDTTAPTDPSALQATPVTPTEIQLAWSGSTDAGGSGLAGYLVERCLGSGCTDFIMVRVSLQSSTADTGLVAQMTYRYRVQAIDGAGTTSGYSNVVEATTPAWPSSAPPVRPPKKPTR
jgi:fibronectin type III domain protein